MEPKVTVIMPNYNYGKYLLEAVESALENDYKNKRVVLVDDCSTDNSWELINERYGSEWTDSDTLYSNNNFYACRLSQNRGQAFAMNVVINEFLKETDFFLPLDTDDVFYKNRISVLVANADQQTCVYSDYHINQNGNIFTEYKKPYSKDLLFRECVVHSSCLFPSQAVVKYGGYDENIWGCHDYDFWLRLSQGFNFKHVPEVTMMIRQTGYNMSDLKTEEKRKKWNENMQKIRQKWT